MKQTKKQTYLNVPMDRERKKLAKMAALERNMSLQAFVTMLIDNALSDKEKKVKNG